MKTNKKIDIEELYVDNDDFKDLIDIVNSTKKSIIFMALSEDFQKTIQLEAIISDSFDVDIRKQTINSAMTKVISKTKYGFVESKLVEAERDTEPAKAWRLTERGKKFQKAVGFLLTYLNEDYTTFSYIIGAMNSSSLQRGSYTRIGLLDYLFRNGSSTLEDICKHFDITPKTAQNKLDVFSNYVDCLGKNLPLIKSTIVGKPRSSTYKVKKKNVKFRKNGVIKKKVYDFIRDNPRVDYQDVCYHFPLLKRDTLSRALSALWHDGSIEKRTVNQNKTYELTPFGEKVVRPLYSIYHYLKTNFSLMSTKNSEIRIPYSIHVLYKNLLDNRPTA